MDSIEQWRREQEEQFKANKEAMYSRLKEEAPEVVRIEVTYDGSGDEGNVEEPNCFDQDGQLVGITEDLEEIINKYVYDVLENQRGGWEIEDGSYGTVNINVLNQTASFDHYARYTDAERAPFKDGEGEFEGEDGEEETE